MAFNFSQVAKDATSLSELMNGREKVVTSDILEKYPEGITITAAEIVEYEKNGETISYPVIHFAENDHVFYTGGIVLKKIVEAWAAHFDTWDEMNAQLAENPVKVKLTSGRSKTGNTITNVDVL